MESERLRVGLVLGLGIHGDRGINFRNCNGDLMFLQSFEWREGDSNGREDVLRGGGIIFFGDSLRGDGGTN